MEISLIDLSIIAVVFVSLVIGFFRGLARETLSLIVWILAFWIAIFHNQSFVNMLTFIDTPVIRKLVAGILLLIGVLFVGGIVNFLLGKLLKFVSLGNFNRIFGMLFGLIRGFFIVFMVIFLIQFSSLAEYEGFEKSKIAPPLFRLSDIVKDKLPEKWIKELKKYSKLKKTKKFDKDKDSDSDSDESKEKESKKKKNNDDTFSDDNNDNNDIENDTNDDDTDDSSFDDEENEED